MQAIVLSGHWKGSLH